jgi:predicted CXXCH cytochrome family protein
VESFPLEVHGKSAKFLDDSRAPQCEVCHENSLEHAEKSTQQKSGAPVGNPSKMDSALANQTCLQCHSRDRYLTDWQGGKHDRNDMSCMSCHSSHHLKFSEAIRASRERALENGNPNLIDAQVPDNMLSSLTVEETCFRCHSDKRKAQFQRSTHLFRTENQVMKVNCVSCHNPHGGEGRKMLVGFSVNETCYQCHAEKRGPFLWEHDPVQQDCMTCHAAHSSNNASLLTKRSHQLCQQCHINMLPRHSTVAGFDVFTYNRGCVNCHSQVHGSNHPSGRTFTR